MWKNLRLRPVMASVLVLAFARETFADVMPNEWLAKPAISKRAWRVGEEPASVTNGKPKYGTSIVTYRDRVCGTVTTNALPTAEGQYTVAFTVAATSAYTGLEETIDFVIAASAEVKNGTYFSIYDYAGRADFTVDCEALGDGTAENFPLCVKINEADPYGFEYGDMKNGTDDLRFFDSSGRALPYEIETWRGTGGESTIWVLMPSVRNGTTFTMCWNLRDGCLLPGNDPKKVWGDFVGVWHFGETIGSGDAAATLSQDSTGNGYAAEPVTYKTGAEDLRGQTYSSAGVFGNARHNSYGDQVKRGCRFEVLNSRLMELGDTFTFTGWFKSERIVSTSSRDGAVIVSRKAKQGEAGGWYAQMLESGYYPDRAMREIYAQGGGSDYLTVKVSDTVMTNQWTFLSLAYDGSHRRLTISGGNKKFVSGQTLNPITSATDNGQTISFGNYTGTNGSDICSFDGLFDEFRIRKGAVSTGQLELEYAQGKNGLAAAGKATNDWSAVLKNGWASTPSITQTTWEADKGLPTLAAFDMGEPNHNKGTQTISFYDRTTGAMLGSDVPKEVGEYRAIISVAAQAEEDVSWGALDHAIEFRIVAGGGTHTIGINVDRILLMNDDFSVSDGIVQWQSYSDELETDDYPYWQHLDEYGDDASSTPPSPEYEDDWSVVLDYNLGGGTRHVCSYGENWLWFLDGVRVGNTFRNGAYYDDRGTKGLLADQNYLPWNAASQRVIGDTDSKVGDLHRYVGQVVMQNRIGAEVVSTCHTNGIGTIYFDAVNGWANNVRDVDGGANYGLRVQIATSAGGGAHPPLLEYTSSNPGWGAAAYDPFQKADWRDVPMRVLRFDGKDCTDFGMREELTLDIEDGGSCEHFYRVIVSVTNAPRNARFRIYRTAIDPIYTLNPDGEAYILLDNIICSPPTTKVQLEPCGEYFPKKTGKQVLGFEGAFEPPFPAASDAAVYGRAKGTVNGSPVGSGMISAATMHYRWHYLEQKRTDWMYADLDPTTLVSHKPLELPPFEGDIEFWFDLNQNVDYYRYADYSGTGLGLGGISFTEEVTSVTNQAPTAVQLSDGARMGDWFVRTREGQSDYSEMKLVVKGKGAFDMVVSEDHIWRGFLSTSNIVTGGVLWRIEPRNRQTAGAQAWNWSTNYWHVMDWAQSGGTAPTFPAAGRMSEGTTNSWCQMPENAVQTGYLMFQVDELTMGVTVVRSDYQNFKDWNGSKGMYFVGSFTDPSGKKGSSANVRTYDEKYAGWTDTVATNSDWELHFKYPLNDPIYQYPGYTTFASFDGGVFAPWRFGKGMWVYGNYRDSASNAALQMAGCGEGYAEMSNETGIEKNWPRGIGEVSFKARIAQEISPEYGAFYDGGDLRSMTNYAFMARTCFDQWANQAFSGSAALSMFAYYRAGKGCYEARWEQISGKISDDAENLGSMPIGQRLVISRWISSGGRYVEEELVATTNATLWKAAMPMMLEGVSTNNFMPFVISAYNTTNATYIVAAVRIDKDHSPDAGGVHRKAKIENDSFWYCVTYRDDSSKRLKNGSYGVLSSNCEGQFMTPQFSAKPVWPGSVTKREDVVTKNDYPVAMLGNYASSDFNACAQDLADDWWTVSWDDPGRMEVIVERDASNPALYDYGLLYVPPYQTVDVYTRPRTSSTWGTEPIDRIVLDGFGSPGNEPDCYTNLCYTTDCHLRLQTGGGLDDYRTDVVIKDIVVTQWRGEDDWATKARESTARQAEYGRTNVVFTSGWVTNGAVRLSAKRTAANTACSVRSPLLDGIDGRGIGLGVVDFTYRTPHTTNVCLQVQIVTNYTVNADKSLKDLSRSVETGDGNRYTWHTVTNLTYETLKRGVPDGEELGHISVSLGLHGVQGLMRVAVSNDLVASVKDVTDPTAFGEIDIVEVLFKDEPPLDKGCWWGWNMKTVGNIFDTERRMFLPDCTTDLAELGQSLALNNSTTADVSPLEDPEVVRNHVPFLQSPTFTNAVIGQVTFKARKYDLSDVAPAARVMVYGATQNPDHLATDKDWTFIEEFKITNALYTTYTCKTDAQNFYALRLAVVLPEGETDNPPEEALGMANPQRVLIDEVSISEAVRALLAFRNVGAFRTNLVDNAYAEGVTTRAQQPLCDENWGIQAELFATMLGEEILIDEGHQPTVKLHWYVGKEPWGYANWKDLPIDKKNRTRYTAELKQTDGSNLVYRSSYKTSPDAVLPAQADAGTVVQYMLEVRYWTLNPTKEGAQPVPATNWLDAASWTVPEWFAPVDYNADPQYGAGKAFAGFTILDTVAPGWAWINEMNVFGARKSGGANSEQALQFCEVCVPAEADLTGWKVRMLDAYLNGKVVTNNVATFGVGKLKGKKDKNLNMKYGKVFRSIGTKEGDGMKTDDGTFDAPWSFSKTTGTFVKGDGYYYIGDYEQPFGVQLIRPSGVIEHSIVVIGTNRWGRLPGTKAYDPTNFVAILNRSVPGSRFFYAGEDCCGEKRTDSVMCGQGESAAVWTNNWKFTSGKINLSADEKTEQIIAQHPTPQGDSIIIYASLDTAVGHIQHRVGDDAPTADPLMIVLRRGSATGTNITYYVKPWYELASVTTNNASFWQYKRCVRETNLWVGAGASNNIYIVGAAQVDSDLAEKYGLTRDNPFTPAVMDWLEGGKILRGDKAFANPGEIHLADFAEYGEPVTTNLTLTQMYCLDIDPTVSNMLFEAGYTGDTPRLVPRGTLENVQLTMFMMITNRNEGAEEPVAWSPYVLRGLAPGSHSWQFKNPSWTGATISSWTSETFKVTGVLRTDKTVVPRPSVYIPLNWFVFHEDSFYQTDCTDAKGEHKRFTAEIELLDPHSQSSPGADAGWYDWCYKHGLAPVWYSWAIDLRLRPISIEVLQPNNYWE